MDKKALLNVEEVFLIHESDYNLSKKKNNKNCIL